MKYHELTFFVQVFGCACVTITKKKIGRSNKFKKP